MQGLYCSFEVQGPRRVGRTAAGVGVLCVGRGAPVARAPGSEPRRALLFPDHPYLEPRHFVDEKAVNENHKDYMFLECILFITEVSGGGVGGVHRDRRLWTEEPVLLPTRGRVGPRRQVSEDKAPLFP